MKRHQLFVFSLLCGLLLHGAEKVVKVSEFNPQPENATAAIQAALDSGADKVIIDKVGFDYQIDRIDFRSNQEVVLEDGVVVSAVEGGHKYGGACLALMYGIENVVLRGEGNAVMRMRKKDYQNLKLYTPSEHRHLLVISACDNITVKDIRLESSGGDGLYITGDAAKKWWSSNVLLENVVSADHHRQGCSVISAEHLRIRNCKFIDTVGTPPAAGIDLEPNNTSQKLTDCVVENCYFKGNAGGAFGAGIHQTLCEPISITFRDCVAEDNPGGSVGSYAGGSKEKLLDGYFEVINCKFRQPKGNAMNFQNFRKGGGFEFRFRDCEIDMTGNPSYVGTFGTWYMEDVDGFDFGNLVIRRSENDRAGFMIGALGAPKFCTPKGSVTFKYPDGKEEQLDLAAYEAQHPGNPQLRDFVSLPCESRMIRFLKPVSQRGASVNGILTRGPQRFLQYAEKDKPIVIRFDFPWHRGNVHTPVSVTDADGNKITEFVLEAERTDYTFNAPFDGVFGFSYSTSVSAANISSTAPGQGFDCSKRMSMISCEQEFYFDVPDGLEEIKVELVSDPDEVACAKLYDENGNLVGETERTFGIQLIKVIRKENERKAAVWRLYVDGKEDFGIRLGEPLVPILYTDPKNMLK